MRYETNERLVDYILGLYKEFHEYMKRQDFFDALMSLRTMICFVPDLFVPPLLQMYDQVKGGISEDRTKDIKQRTLNRANMANNLYVLFQSIHAALNAGGIFTKKTTMLREEYQW
jgi:hypothetical protein